MQSIKSIDGRLSNFILWCDGLNLNVWGLNGMNPKAWSRSNIWLLANYLSYKQSFVPHLCHNTHIILFHMSNSVFCLPFIFITFTYLFYWCALMIFNQNNLQRHLFSDVFNVTRVGQSLAWYNSNRNGNDPIKSLRYTSQKGRKDYCNVMATTWQTQACSPLNLVIYACFM